MFTGIITAIGTIEAMQREGAGMRLTIDAGGLGLDDVALGDSIAVSGPCLTVVTFDDKRFEVDVSAETLARTTLGQRAVGDRVNLEKALRLDTRLGGHLVSGHIDGIGTVVERELQDEYIRFLVEVEAPLSRYLAFKGSVAVDGVSLTVNAVDDCRFELLTIPHTLAETTLGERDTGAVVNIEVDVIARYIERLLHVGSGAGADGGLTIDALARAGFTDAPGS